MKITTTFNQSAVKKVRVRTKDIWQKRVIGIPGRGSETVELTGDASSLFIENKSSEGDVFITLKDYNTTVYNSTIPFGEGVVIPIDNLSLPTGGFFVDTISLVNGAASEASIEITTV